jgi:winged helix DNA-binding protein
MADPNLIRRARADRVHCRPGRQQEHAMPTLTEHHARLIRMRGNCLHPRLSRDQLVTVVSKVGGINAQSNPAMLLALRARVEGLAIHDVIDAITTDRTLVRSWLMRSTMHLVTAEDFMWMSRLFGPIFAQGGRRRRLELGLTDEICTRGVDAIREILSNKSPLTRGEIVERLAKYDIILDRKTQSPINLIGLAAHQGILCIGPVNTDGEDTYVLIDQWVGSKPDTDWIETLEALAVSYIHGYGPVSFEDFAGWSHYPKAGAKIGRERAISNGDYVGARCSSKVLYAAAAELRSFTPPRKPIVRLLPAFDALILGYADRDLLVERRYHKEIYHSNQTVPAILVDGLVAGTWRYQRQGKRMEIRVRSFDSFTNRVMEDIKAEADDIGRFFDLPATLIAET